jgi:hypothetical protein
MNKFIQVSFLVLLSLLASCTVRPPVNTDHESGYDFSTLKSFQVLASTQDTKQDILVSPFTLSHIHQALEVELSKRYTFIAADQKPDFVVTFHVIIEEKIDPRSYDEIYGFGFYGRGYYRSPYPYSPFFYGPRLSTFKQGSLIIDIADAKDNKPIWRGVSEKRLARFMSPVQQREVLSQAVVEVLSQFPPVN